MDTELACQTNPKFVKEGLTFDDVLLIPARSEVLPDEVDTNTRLTRGIRLNIPICSAAMDTVTEARLAIAVAREGGIGIIHRNCSIEEQVHEVDKVKRSESGMIADPITFDPGQNCSRRTGVDITLSYRGRPNRNGGRLSGRHDYEPRSQIRGRSRSSCDGV